MPDHVVPIPKGICGPSPFVTPTLRHAGTEDILRARGDDRDAVLDSAGNGPVRVLAAPRPPLVRPA
jgi:hypothetical protein